MTIAEWFADENHFTKRVLALDDKGFPCDPHSKNVSCTCTEGAIRMLYPITSFLDIRGKISAELLKRNLIDQVWVANDRYGWAVMLNVVKAANV